MLRFTDVISPIPFTRDVLKNVFSFSHSKAGDAWYSYPLMTRVFESAGYKTHWISNHSKYGFHDNVAAVIGSTCHVSSFTEDIIDGQCNTRYDEALLPLLNHVNPHDTLNFIVIHLMGSHFSYKSRYPQSFAQFEGNEYYDKPFMNDKAKALNAEYDNSVLYNDSVLGEIYRYFAHSDALIFYLSDHGEEMYDFRNFSGRSTTDFTRFMLEVPFTIWLSDSFKERSGYDEPLIANALHRPFMIDDVIHTVLDGAYIESDDFDATRSLLSPRYNEKRPRFIKTIDYDKHLKQIE